MSADALIGTLTKCSWLAIDPGVAGVSYPASVLVVRIVVTELPLKASSQI
jgi:hypothetical protein